MGGQIQNTYEVDNYPGLPGISGMDLGEAFENHVQKLGVSPVRENVLAVEDTGAEKIIRTKKNEYRARTVVLACGASHRMLEIPGEQEFSGMGVSYCATCDGAFFKDKTAVVVGGGNIAAEDALFLSRICRKVLYGFTDVMHFGQIRSFRTVWQLRRISKWYGTAWQWRYRARTV